MTKKLREEVMTRSCLRNKYNKNYTYKNWSNIKNNLKFEPTFRKENKN